MAVPTWQKFVALTLGCTIVSEINAQDSKPLVSGIEMENISTAFGPGKDFYEYVNEGWLAKTKIPEDQSNYGSFTALDDATKEAIKSLIEKSAADLGTAKGPAKQVGSFYRSFSDVESRNALGAKPLEKTLAKIRAIQSKAEWAKTAAELNRIGVGGLFGLGIEPDAKKSDQYAVYLNQGGTTLPDRDYYLKSDQRYQDVLKAYRQYIIDLSQMFAHPSPSDVAEHVLGIETQLAEAQWTQVELRDPIKNYNKMKMSELAQRFSSFDFPSHVSQLGVPKELDIIVGQPSFIDGCNKTFGNASLESLKDFLFFSAIDNYAPALSESIEKRHFEFHQKTLTGVSEQKPLWRRAVEACNGRLGMPVGQLYVEKYFSPEAKSRMELLVQNLKQAFAERIAKLDWMGRGTKQQANEKLGKFSTKIGYPAKWKDYSTVEISPTDLASNLMRLAEFEHDYQVKKRGRPIDRTEWMMSPQTINAYYNPLMNEIVFPAAILQPPFFNLKADDAVNYGGIGAVIGHELSHGFDDSGSRFDGDGNLREWWTQNDREEFERRAGLLAIQYNAYKPFADMSVDGKLTL